MRDALAWYIVVQVAGLAVWPLVSRALAPLEDRGWAASKVAGLLGVAWLVWFVCMLSPLPFTRTTLIVALLAIGAGAWLLELRSGGIEPVLVWLRTQRRLVLSFEAIFLGGFVLFAVLRAHAPAVAATEKPMDMAFLNGFMTAQSLPTQDTWLAGFSVPYYHFGYFVLAYFGNSVTPGVWPPTDNFWWFNASRVIPNLQPDGIDEFPFFSALLSDLHPHFMALPFELLVLTIAAAHVVSRGATLRSTATQGLAALALGGLLVINTWDIAPFWLLYVGLSLYAGHFSQWRWRWLAAALTPLVGALVYAPYFVGYAGPPLGLGIVTSDRTPLASLLVLFGWAIVLLASLGTFTRWCIGDRRGWQITAGGAVVGVALAVLGQPGLGLLIALLGTLL